MKGGGHRLRLALHLSAAVALVGRAALAAGPSHVRVEGPVDDPVTQRVVLELRSSGFVVFATEAPAAAASHADNGGAVDAVVRVGPESILVWWVDRSGVRVGEPEVLDAHPGDDPAVGAVRTAEIVRARLLPAERPSTVSVSLPPVGSPEVETPRPAPLSSSHMRFGFNASGVAIVSRGGVPPAYDVALMARWLPVERLVVRALVTVPVALPTMSSAQGQASVREWLFGGAAEWRLLSADSPWEATVGVGAAAAYFQTRGEGLVPFVGARGDGWTTVPFVDASVSRSLGSPYVRAGVQLLAGTAAPEITIVFAGRDVAKWGGLLVGTALGIEVDAY